MTTTPTGLNTNFFLYIRVSTEDQDPLAQKLEAQRFVARNPAFKIAAIYEERTSAWSHVPAKLVQLIKDIEALPLGQRPNVLVKCVDRFSRNINYGTECLEKILSLGVEIMFFDMPKLNVRDPAHRITFNDLLARSQGYSDLQSAKIKESLEVRREAGLATTKEPIFGTEFFEVADGEGASRTVRKYVRSNLEEITVQSMIAMLNGDYTNDQIMRALRVYEAMYGKAHVNRSMYDHGYVSFENRHKIFFDGTDKKFADIMNYFKLYKRGVPWTAGTIRYQWVKYIQPKATEFENFIDNSLLIHPVPEWLLLMPAEPEPYLNTFADSSCSSSCAITEDDLPELMASSGSSSSSSSDSSSSDDSSSSFDSCLIVD